MRPVLRGLARLRPRRCVLPARKSRDAGARKSLSCGVRDERFQCGQLNSSRRRGLGCGPASGIFGIIAIADFPWDARGGTVCGQGRRYRDYGRRAANGATPMPARSRGARQGKHGMIVRPGSRSSAAQGTSNSLDSRAPTRRCQRGGADVDQVEALAVPLSVEPRPAWHCTAPAHLGVRPNETGIPPGRASHSFRSGSKPGKASRPPVPRSSRRPFRRALIDQPTTAVVDGLDFDRKGPAETAGREQVRTQHHDPGRKMGRQLAGADRADALLNGGKQ